MLARDCALVACFALGCASTPRIPALPPPCATSRPEVDLLGEVNVPQALPLAQGATLALDQALRRAGGVNRIAWFVVVTRASCAGRRASVRIPLEAALDGSSGVVLAAGDVVFVDARE